MGRRIFMGNDSGLMKLRVSGLSTIDAKTAPETDLTFYETMSPMVPKEKGTLVFGGAGTQNIALTKSYSYPPFFLLKSSLDVVPGYITIYATIIISSLVIQVTNNMGANTINWYVFDEL